MHSYIDESGSTILVMSAAEAEEFQWDLFVAAVTFDNENWKDSWDTAKRFRDVANVLEF